MTDITPYTTIQDPADGKRTRFLFESVGERTITKAIEFSPIETFENRTIFNLGFGDLDLNSGEIADDLNSNNGDMRRVFNTVLHSVPLFFQQNPMAGILVRGSDSSAGYFETCIQSCLKRCVDDCKNIDRRIKVYRYYIEKHFAPLTMDYLLFGSFKEDKMNFAPFRSGESYTTILVFQKPKIKP